MAAYLNMSVIAGVLGNDAVLHPQANGHTVIMVRIATRDAWRDTQGARQERTEWHNIVYWARTAAQAAFLQKALRKGWTVTVTGSSRTREYTDPQGVRRYITEVHADNVQPGGPVQSLTQLTQPGRATTPPPPPAPSAQVLTHPAARHGNATNIAPAALQPGYAPRLVDPSQGLPIDAEPLYHDFGPPEPLQHF